MKHTLIFALLLFLGSFKALADLAGWEKLSGLAAASNVSPAMKVFTAHKGFETHSSEFWLKISWADGRQQEIQLTPASYAGLKGPYNRRNAYGAALAYGPLLIRDPRTQDMYQSVSHYALCDPATLIAELFPEQSFKPVTTTIDIRPRQAEMKTEWATPVEVSCVES